MIERTFDAERVNAVLNDSSVYPSIRGQQTGPLNSRSLLADSRNVALFGEHGGIIFRWHQAGLYRLHPQVTSSGRGDWARDMAHSAMAWMFSRTDALEIIGTPPVTNLAACGFFRKLGFAQAYPDQPVFADRDDTCAIFSLF